MKKIFTVFILLFSFFLVACSSNSLIKENADYRAKNNDNADVNYIIEWMSYAAENATLISVENDDLDYYKSNIASSDRWWESTSFIKLNCKVIAIEKKEGDDNSFYNTAYIITAKQTDPGMGNAVFDFVDYDNQLLLGESIKINDNLEILIANSEITNIYHTGTPELSVSLLKKN